MITQLEISQFEEARKLRTKAQEREKQLRDHIANDSVEGGNLDLEVSSRASMQYRADELRAALAPKAFRELESQVNPVRQSKVCSADAEKQKAKETADVVRKYLAEQGWPSPWVVDSGNGYHLYYHCDLDVKDDVLVGQLLKSLANKFDTENAKIDTAIGDLAGMCRMPGTCNRKGPLCATSPVQAAEAGRFFEPWQATKIMSTFDWTGVDRNQ